jgi:hypothetical protein
MTAERIARELWWTNQEFYPVDIIPSWLSMLTYYLGGDRSSETLSRPMDMNTIPYSVAVS